MGTITTAMCNSFKQELLGGVHDLDTHSLKIALIKPSPTSSFSKATTNYSDLTANSDEATGTNYSAGGQVLVLLLTLSFLPTLVMDPILPKNLVVIVS